MTWREFSLRLMGFRRQQKEEWIRTREVAYSSLIAGGMDPKKLTKEQFMPLENKVTKKASNAGLEALRKAQEPFRNNKPT